MPLSCLYIPGRPLGNKSRPLSSSTSKSPRAAAPSLHFSSAKLLPFPFLPPAWAKRLPPSVPPAVIGVKAPKWLAPLNGESPSAQPLCLSHFRGRVCWVLGTAEHGAFPEEKPLQLRRITNESPSSTSFLGVFPSRYTPSLWLCSVLWASSCTI